MEKKKKIKYKTNNEISKWVSKLKKIKKLIKKRNYPFKHQTHEIVKHIQTIRREQPTNCLSVLDHFVGLALKGLRIWNDS